MANELLTWIDSTNASHALDGSSTANPLAFEGAQGLRMPPIAQLDQRTPLQPGTSIKYTDIQARPVTIPLLVSGAGSETTLWSQLRAMVDTWFAAPGTLRYTGPDGTSRDLLNCYYLGGLEGDESYPSRKPGSLEVPLQLLATEPFWHDTADTVINYTNTQIFNGFTSTNNGAYECYPAWVFKGPFINLVMADTTTGYKIDLTANGGINFLSTDTLTIDTNAGTLLKQDGSDMTGFLTTDSVLFPLAVGNNAISFTYSGGVNGVTAATLTFRQRYRSP